MSGIGIIDLSKPGVSAEVDDTRRLKTNSAVENEIARVSREDSSSFVIYMKRDCAVTATNEYVGFLQYTGSKSLKISSITFSSNSADAKFEVFYDAVYSSGGTALSTDVNILNQNRGSANPLSVTAYSGASTLTLTTDSNKEVLDVRLNKSTHRQPFDGLILTKNKTIGILTACVFSGTDNRARIMIECYEV